MEWDDRYNIGLPRIDQQHRELVGQLGRLHDAMHAGDRTVVVAVLDFLDIYVAEHFSEEETQMRESKYPYTMSHRTAHAHFVDELGRLRREYQETGPTPWLSIRVRRALLDWLKDHIQAMDQDFARHLRARSSAS